MDEEYNTEIRDDQQMEQLKSIGEQLAFVQLDNQEPAALFQSAVLMVHQLFQNHKNMLMERPDRFELYELQEIIEGKANIRDFQILIDQLLKQGVLKKNQILSNLVNESQMNSQTRLSRSQLSVDNECQNNDPVKLDQDGGKKQLNTIDHKLVDSNKENCFQSPISKHQQFKQLNISNSQTNNRQMKEMHAELNDISSINDCDVNMGPSALRQALIHEEEQSKQHQTEKMDANPNSPIFNSVQQYQLDQFEVRLQNFQSSLEQIQSNIEVQNKQFEQFLNSKNNINIPEDLVPEKEQKNQIQIDSEQIKQLLKAQMDEFKAACENKANKSSVANALHRKANKQDLTKMQTELNHKFKDLTSKLDKMLGDLSNFFKENKKTIKQFDDTIDNLKKDKQRIEVTVNDQYQQFEQTLDKKVRDISERLGKNQKQSRISSEEIAVCFRNYALEVYGAAILQDNKQSNPLMVILDHLFESKFKTLDLNDRFQQLISHSSKQLENKINTNLNSQLADEVEQLEIQMNSLRDQVKKKKKTEEEQFQSKVDLHVLTQNVKELQGDIKTKANINDVCALVDSKASTTSVFQLLDEMKKSIVLLSAKIESSNASQKHFDSFLKQQNYINDQLCPLNCVAQFQWFGHLGSPKKFSEPIFSQNSLNFNEKVDQNKMLDFRNPMKTLIKKAYQLKWASNQVNSCPDSIQLNYEKEAQITLKEPGIYSLNLVFIFKQKVPVDVEFRIDELVIDQDKKQYNQVIQINAFVKTEKPNSKIQVYLYQQQKHQTAIYGLYQNDKEQTPNTSFSLRSNSESRQTTLSSKNTSSYCDTQANNSSSSIFSPGLAHRKQSLNERIIEQTNQTKRQLAGNFATRENEKIFMDYISKLEQSNTGQEVLAIAEIRKM